MTNLFSDGEQAVTAGADAGLYHHEQHMEGVEYQEWIAFGTTAPSEIRGLDGVPVIWVYSPAPK